MPSLTDGKGLFPGLWGQCAKEWCPRLEVEDLSKSQGHRVTAGSSVLLAQPPPWRYEERHTGWLARGMVLRADLLDS